MDLKRLPFLPLHFFYYQLSEGNRRLFLVITSVCVLAAGLMVFSYSDPYFWAQEIVEVAEPETQEVQVKRVEHHYRSFDISLNAFRQWVNYSASPILPKAFPVIAFWFFQAIAWSLFLAVATTIRSKWIYAFYFLIALFLHFSGIAQTLLPEKGLLTRTLEFGIIILFLGLGHLFQMKIVKWPLPGRWALFTGMMMVLFSIPLMTGGWLSLQLMGAESFSFLFIVGIFFLYFIGKEPTNLIILAATNRPEISGRLGWKWILGIMIFYLVILFIWMNEFMRFGLFTPLNIGIRPIHLVFISGIFTVFTSQNQFRQFQAVIPSLAGFTFFLLSWSIMILSFFFLHFASGDIIFVRLIDRLAAVLFAAIGLFHILFIFINHRLLLKQKVNLYYLMTRGPLLSYNIVWLVGLVGLISAEGRDNWTTINLAYHTWKNQQGDHAILSGNSGDAIGYYETAIGQSLSSPKSNFNLASLYLGDRNRIKESAKYYQQATKTLEFFPARINAANLFALNNQSLEARQILKEGMTKDPNGYVANNLALMYVKAGMPDSAIITMKEGLLTHTDLAGGFSNLGLIYMDNQKQETAAEFFEAAAGLSSSSNSAAINSLMFSLKEGSEPPEEALKIKNADNYFLSYNQLLWELKQDPASVDRKVLKYLADQDQSPDALLLDGYLMFMEDSIEYALSRMKFLENAFTSYSPRANYLIGVGYYQKGVPEMAQEYFRKAGEAGDPTGTLYAAKMNIELGRADSANFELSALRAEHEELWEPCAKELAMLLQAYGQGVYAQTEYNLSALSADEMTLIGIYADSMNQYVTALESFRAVQAMDSASIVPYLELARIYNKYQDTLAIETLRYGLDVAPGNPRLQMELAEALINAGQTEEAGKILESILSSGEYRHQLDFLVARETLAKGDTTMAIQRLDSLHQAKPLDTEVILLLARLYRETGKTDEGNVLITEAINRNTANAEIWYYYAVYSRAWNLNADAGYGAIKAIELSNSEKRKQEISAEFAEEIRQVALEQ